MAERLRLVSTLEWREVEGEIVALDLDQSVYLAANVSGALLWRTLGEGTTRTELVNRLAETYSLPAAEAERDVSAFLARLDECGYLERS